MKSTNRSDSEHRDPSELFDVEITTPLPALPAEDVLTALEAGLDTVHADAELSIDPATENISVTQTIRSRERAQALGAAESNFYAAIFAGGRSLSEWDEHVDDDMSVHVRAKDVRAKDRGHT